MKKKLNRKDKQQIDFVKKIEEQIKEDKMIDLEKAIVEPIKLPSVYNLLKEKKASNRNYQNLKFISDNAIESS